MNGTDHLPFVPRLPERLDDPYLRAELLLLDWEGDSPSSVCGVLLSKRCANSETGLAFTASLVKAAYEQETNS